MKDRLIYCRGRRTQEVNEDSFWVYTRKRLIEMAPWGDQYGNSEATATTEQCMVWEPIISSSVKAMWTTVREYCLWQSLGLQKPA